MKRKRIKMIALISAGVLLLAGCSKAVASPEESGEVKQEESVLIPVDSCQISEGFTYEDEGTADKLIATYQSSDGLCVIRKMEHYYDVTLDYEKGTAEEVGRAYAETIFLAFPEYEQVMEPFLYENIEEKFPDIDGKYDVIEERLDGLFCSVPQMYKEEAESFAQALSEGETGFVPNGEFSYEEALLMQIVPDALRGTACSALCLWGDKTVSGEGITFRSLEWNLGSSNQLCMAHAVVHMKKGENSITSISVLGLLDILSAINDDGVFAAILDVGCREPYTYEGKKCYTYELRYALENFDNARDVGMYMVENSADFTWCNNIVISDEESRYCAENAVAQALDNGMAFSNLRGVDTPLLEGLQWDNEDSFCVVNSFASAGNMDGFRGSNSNMVRFAKYNKWASSLEKFSVADVKNTVTQEKARQVALGDMHAGARGGILVYQQIIVDYNTGRIQVAFTGVEGLSDKPIFTDIGGWN